MSDFGRIDGEFFLPDITPDFIKSNYLMGLEPLVNGEPVKNSFWEYWIKSAIKHIEKQTQVTISRASFKNEPHDYHCQDYQNFVFILLNNRPLVHVDHVTAVYPNNQTIFTFPDDWITPHFEAGQLQLVPTHGSLSSILLGQGGGIFPLISQTLTFIPSFFRVTYTAGFNEGAFPEDIVDAICKKVAIEVLAQMGDLMYGPGISSMSTSIDGMSQSVGIVNNGNLGAVFTSRISQYRKDLYGEPGGGLSPGTQRGLIDSIRAYYRGIVMSSL